MAGHTIRIDGKHFALAPTENLTTIKEQVLAAVHSGGGFITIRQAGDEIVEVLLTPHSRLMIEEIPHSRAATAAYVGALVADDGRANDTVFDFDVYQLDGLSV